AAFGQPPRRSVAPRRNRPRLRSRETSRLRLRSRGTEPLAARPAGCEDAPSRRTPCSPPNGAARLGTYLRCHEREPPNEHGRAARRLSYSLGVKHGTNSFLTLEVA